MPLQLILMAATLPAQPPEDPLITELRSALSASASQELQFAVAESDRAVVFALDTATMTPDRARVFAYEAVEHDGVTHFERLDARPELPGVQPFEISLRLGPRVRIPDHLSERWVPEWEFRHDEVGGCVVISGDETQRPLDNHHP